ncbi:undecaprenyl-diphosphate phosphatase [Vibrio gazogenes]|jgi:undecaprenyl-diphosphatase|uniref:Undecaprenyl-diphosphatase n=1 Tax=Vibrio gazogenes DSM 21264 = NBRC 103151 TaxID=1123492 RepID=A0A1M4WG33_VIBGA|nr:undecaprenyl-diphosphate phosphatase [Vibrio gazogenes]USP13222.1 undecaprenyl-diphosphate phosphatase [Vibrio gazogenes]SHE80145.1 undecaprenyl-diphosphatase [Vibrio gazogenes DSM 21264] [Vibrio gazogenes DSM 21264 = NBRC 103151]SJN54367.1 Undecaprenyl-diphosphatase [Vibrio gazogenes]
MDLIQSVILGLVEGITEFLPISSTGHLIIVSDWLGLSQTESNKAFEVIIQLSAILAVLTNYKERFHPRYFALWMKVCIAFLPIAAIGFLFQDQVKALFNIQVVPIMFIIGGIIFLIVERFLKNHAPTAETLDQITYRQAIWIGIAQVFALVPGTSRAGSTIVGALLVGVSRKASAEFSFLLALPVMLAASGLDLLKNYQDFQGESALPLIVGFITSYISAWVVMKLFLAFLNRFTFNAFGIYRIVFGGFLLYWAY